MRYISEDGTVFEKEEDCLAYEGRRGKLYKFFVNQYKDGKLVTDPNDNYFYSVMRITEPMPQKVFNDFLSDIKEDADVENYPFDAIEFWNTPSVYFWHGEYGYVRIPMYLEFLLKDEYK